MASRAGDEGIPPGTAREKQFCYPWPETRDAYHEHLRDQGREERTLVDVNAERAELTRVKRMDAELELARKRQELITVADVAAIVSQALDIDPGPAVEPSGPVGPELVGVTSIAETVELLDRAVREILATLQGIADHVEEPESPRRSRPCVRTRLGSSLGVSHRDRSSYMHRARALDRHRGGCQPFATYNRLDLVIIILVIAAAPFHRKGLVQNRIVYHLNVYR